MTIGKKQGFTIVELMIVIVVIAILAAISIVAYTGVQRRAQISVAQSDLRSLGQAIQIYQVENGQYPVGWTQLVQALTEGGAIELGSARDGSHPQNFMYCMDEGQDMWIVVGDPLSPWSSDSGYDGPMYYWHGQSGGLGTADYADHGHSTNLANTCESVAGHSVGSRWWSHSL